MIDCRAGQWLVFGGYLLIAGGAGDLFPVSRFDMYADVSHRHRTALPVFLANDEPAVPEDYERFTGLETGASRWREFPTSTAYLVRDWMRWIGENRGQQEGPDHVRFGYRMLSWDDGVIEGEIVWVMEGYAWAR